LVEVAPVAAGGLLDGAGLLVRQRAATGNPVELVEELIFLHRARGRIDGVVGIALLGAHGRRAGDDERERHRADDQTHARQKRRHDSFLLVRRRPRNRTIAWAAAFAPDQRLPDARGNLPLM
jgi:hypothetical protein